MVHVRVPGNHEADEGRLPEHLRSHYIAVIRSTRGLSEHHINMLTYGYLDVHGGSLSTEKDPLWRWAFLTFAARRAGTPGFLLNAAVSSLLRMAEDPDDGDLFPCLVTDLCNDTRLIDEVRSRLLVHTVAN